jgi:hypothetical protein
MTVEEAIFCEKSYIGETDCADCKYYRTDTCKSRESHKMAIKALEQTRPKGKWIFREDMGHQYCCSECGCPKPFVNDYYYKKIIGCPYCLADMRGESE